MQLALVAFDRQHIVGLSATDGFGRLNLAVERIQRDDVASQGQFVEQSRHRSDLVGGRVYLLLAKHLESTKIHHSLIIHLHKALSLVAIKYTFDFVLYILISCIRTIGRIRRRKKEASKA